MHPNKLGPGGRSTVIEQQSIDVSFRPGNGRLCLFEAEGPLLAGLRPSSLNASGLIGVGRSSTLSNLLSYLTADTRDEARG